MYLEKYHGNIVPGFLNDLFTSACFGFTLLLHAVIAFQWHVPLQRFIHPQQLCLKEQYNLHLSTASLSAVVWLDDWSNIVNTFKTVVLFFAQVAVSSRLINSLGNASMDTFGYQVFDIIFI